MSFLNRVNQGVQQNVLLRGGSAPREKIVRAMLKNENIPPRILLRPAPPQSYRANMPGNTEQTPIQKAYVIESAKIKAEAKGQRVSSWVGKSFG